MYVVVGLGATGLSCIRFLRRHKLKFIAMDTRDNPPTLTQFKAEYPDVALYTGSLPEELLMTAETILLSPGVSAALPAIAKAKAAGVRVIGDIELFAQYNKVPVIAITGANGKSTVTALVGEMARMAGLKVAVIGNIGTPVLDVLNDGVQYELIVMELSSFQLETTHSLQPMAATILNLTPDHLDRYATMADYAAAKHRIHTQAQQVIINKQDPYSVSNLIVPTAKRTFFSLEEPAEREFGLRWQAEEEWLAFGQECWLPTRSLKLVGRHNIANALSALALGMAAGLPRDAMLKALQSFSGLSHRCQWVAQQKEITWINDSKGTNIGACLAALKGLGEGLKGKIIILLGGDGKGADFTELKTAISQYCRAMILMGKDAETIFKALEGTVPAYQVGSMSEAVLQASELVLANDLVLLSPACASWDQYKDYAHRGEVFINTVKEIVGSHEHSA